MRERSLCVGFRVHYFKFPINIKLRNCVRGVVVGSEKLVKIVGLYFYSSWCRIDTNNSTSGSTELAFCWKEAVYQCIFNLFHVTIIRLTSCQIRFSCSSDIDIFLKFPVLWLSTIRGFLVKNTLYLPVDTIERNSTSSSRPFATLPV